MLESRISAGATEKIPCSANIRISSWCYDYGGSCKQCVERYWELANKTTQNSTKYQLHALMTIISKKKNWNPWENCQNCALKLFWNACTWHVLEDWYSMVSEQTCTVDHKMDPSSWQTIISFDLLHSLYMWKQTVLQCGKDCQTMQTGTVSRLRFCRILRIQNLHQVEHCAFLEVIHLFQSVGCARNRLSVSHSSTESEIISLDAGLSLDGIPALDLWDLIVADLHGNTNQSNQARRDLCTNQREVRSIPHTIQKQKKSPWNDRWFGQRLILFRQTSNLLVREALLYVFEDNEAGIKMIIKGRSPTMRHVSRTPQSCSWLVVR